MKIWNLTDIVGEPTVLEAGVRIAPGGSTTVRAAALKRLRRRYPASSFSIGVEPPGWYTRAKQDLAKMPAEKTSKIEKPVEQPAEKPPPEPYKKGKGKGKGSKKSSK